MNSLSPTSGHCNSLEEFGLHPNTTFLRLISILSFHSASIFQMFSSGMYIPFCNPCSEFTKKISQWFRCHRNRRVSLKKKYLLTTFINTMPLYSRNSHIHHNAVNTNSLSCYWDKLDKVCVKDRGKESRIDTGWLLKKIAFRKGDFYHKIFG